MAAVKNFIMALSPMVIIRKSNARDLELKYLRILKDQHERTINQLRYENKQLNFKLEEAIKPHQGLLESMYIQSEHAARAIGFIENAGLKEAYSRHSELHPIRTAE